MTVPRETRDQRVPRSQAPQIATALQPLRLRADLAHPYTPDPDMPGPGLKE